MHLSAWTTAQHLETAATPGDDLWVIRGILDRIGLAWCRVSERIRFGRVPAEDQGAAPALIVVGGVGRFQFAPYMIRRVFRTSGRDLSVLMFDWQFGLVGEIWTDLTWLKRNRLQGAKLARRLLRMRRDDPNRRIHLFAYSGGAAIAVFACEYLGNRGVVDTLVLGHPALSPGYDLSKALGAVRRCYTLVSRRDSVVLGLGTRIFGTVDRRFGLAAGLIGFTRPSGLPDMHTVAYDRCRVLHWTPAWRSDGHGGGHTGCIAAGFLRRYLPEMLDGTMSLRSEPIPEADAAESSRRS